MTIRLLTGDARDVLPTLPADSVHCVVCSPPYWNLRSYLDASHPDKHREIGLEATPEAYLATMVQVFREVRRVMRPDATLWCNMGDSYRDKQLLLMPARLALALQADGWWVRSAIVWAKPNPMPESVSDRPTSAYEMVYLLTRSSRYYYDADAVREAHDPNSPFWAGHPNGQRAISRTARLDGNNDAAPNTWLRELGAAQGRNLRNVWTLATHAFPEAHFATYPPELVERCIKAGTSERGCCAACGKPWVRVIERGAADLVHQRACGGDVNGEYHGASTKGHTAAGVQDASAVKARILAGMVERATTGWSPGCKCDAGDPTPCTVLDPFLGSGTSALVADRLQRHAIGIDLSLTYAEMAQRRIEMDAGMFAELVTAEPPEDERMRDLFEGDEYQRLAASVPDTQRKPFRSERYMNQGPRPSNGMPEAAE